VTELAAQYHDASSPGGRSHRLIVAAHPTLATYTDVGDSWEFLDDPRYPVKYTVFGTELGVNYVVYAMTH